MTRTMAPDDPERIGGYWLAGRLGAGGQGTVYEAYDGAGARVALKVLHPGAPAPVRERFAREAEAARAVPTFCTARIRAVSADEGQPFLVSDYIAGPALSARVRGDGPLDADAVERLAVGTATALAAIHGAGVVHRDLKPGNVLLGPDGPRIIDFGIARAPDMTLTATGGMAGTPGYMAPEVLAGKRATGAADVFAWGAVVLFAATGEEPFRGAHVGEVVHRTTELDPDLSALPAGVRSLVAAALAKKPHERPSSVELLAALMGARPESGGLLEEGARQADSAGNRPFGTSPALVDLTLGEAAEAAYTALPASARTTAREVLLRMVEPFDDAARDTVRTVSHEELYAERAEGEDAAVRACVETFAAAGVLRTADDGSTAPVSAALLPAWQRLRTWVAEDRDNLRTHRALGRDLRTWLAHGERDEDLPQGSGLRLYLDWAARTPVWIRPGPREVRFLDTARARSVRTVRMRRRLVTAASVFVAMALIAAGIFWQQARQASHQRDEDIAVATVRAARELSGSAPDTSRLLGLAAWRIADTAASREELLSAAVRREAEMFTLPDDGYAGTALSADGRVLTWDSGFWDLSASGRGGRRPVQVDRSVAAGAGDPLLSPDGRTALIGVVGEDGHTRISTRTGKPVGKPVGGPVGDLAEAEEAEPIALSNKGDLLLVSDGPDAVVDAEGTVITTGERLMALSADGRYVAGCEAGDVVVRPVGGDTSQGVAMEQPCPGEDGAVRFDPSGRYVLLSGGSPDESTGVVEGDSVVDARTGASIHPTTLQGYHGLSFSSRGNYVIGQDQDNGLVVLSSGSRLAVVFETTEPGAVTGPMALDEETGTLTYLLPELREVHRIGLAEILGGDGPKAASPGPDPAYPVGYSDDGRTVLTVSQGFGEDPVLRVIDTDTGKPLGKPSVQTGWGRTEGIPFRSLSGNGRYVAYDTVSYETRDGATWMPWILDVTTGRRTRLPVPQPENHLVHAMVLAADASHLSIVWDHADATATSEPFLQVFDRRGRKIREYRGARNGHLFLPDGLHHLTTRGELLDLRTGGVTKLPFPDEEYAAITVSPDGRTLAALTPSGALDLWDTRLRERTERIPGPGSDGSGKSAPTVVGLPTFSQNGRSLAVPLDEGVQIWDVPGRVRLGTPLDLGSGPDDVITFRDNALRFIDNERVRTVDLTPDALAATVCERVGRDITREEWATYIPAAEYRELC
ncbi:protein kinase domain-containing protein [Streptomyces sp. MAR4 CNX-425]|uniref:protein kinase domain-containing protein n=1 Tax=Streptomyces sp. MAR4 CNX-425 TaxID=3406343 RepID=UPI003B513E96